MRCPKCGCWLDPLGGPYMGCPACGNPFLLVDMIGETKAINRDYEEAKKEWRSDIANQWIASGEPHWQCKVCKRIYTTKEPRHRVCRTCLSGEEKYS